MTPTDASAAAPEPVSSDRVSDFAYDTAPMSTGLALRDYRDRLRSGELGALPALLGLAALVIGFTIASDKFLTLNNLANLLAQGAGYTIIAMGLVFVLLIGEIDVSAGAASGVCAAVMALHYVSDGSLQDGMGSGVFVIFIAVLVLAALLAFFMRIWAAGVLALIAVAIALIGGTDSAWIEILLAISVGAAIGTLTGFLVARLQMPSFVVTLALFLTWQGVVIQLVGNKGELGIGSSKVLFEVANGNLSVAASWALFAIAAGGFGLVMIGEQLLRRRRELITQPWAFVIAKVVGICGLGAVATALLAENRAPTANIVISGIPYVVPIILFLLTIGTYALNRTRYGAHVYAVGGNREAALRSGVDVAKIRASVFVIASTFAAVGAIVYSSKVGSVDSTAGGLNTLLFAIGAAVIGGTSLYGGKGRLYDAVIGGLVIAVVQNGLGLVHQSAATVSIVTGLVLMIAAGVDTASRRGVGGETT